MAGRDGFNAGMAAGECWMQGVLTKTPLDQLPPCTATPDNTCQIVDHLSKLNQFLFYAELELRELPTQNGNLSLTSFADEGLCMPHDGEGRFKQAVALVHQLLKTHSCIHHVYIHRRLFITHAPLICDALKRNLSTKVLNIDLKKTIFGLDLCSDCDDVEQLDESECSCSKLSSALSIILRDCSSLNTLEVGELQMKRKMATAFVAALKENLTLKELSIHGSVICEAERDQFAQYLCHNVSLTVLSITADNVSKRNCFLWMAVGLLVNNTIRNVRLNNVLFDQDNVMMAARIFAENDTIRIFNMVYLAHTFSRAPSTDYGLWLAPLSNNETLEELGLPFSIWNSLQWVGFFSVIARKQNLKKLTVALKVTDYRYLPELCAALRETGAEDKVSLGTHFVDGILNLVQSRALLDVDVFCLDKTVIRQLHALQAFNHVTSVCFRLKIGQVSITSAIARYVEATTSLRRLQLDLYPDHDSALHDKNASFMAIVQSLSRNTSVRELELNFDHCVGNSVAMQDHNIEQLAHVVGTSRRVRRFHFRAVYSHGTAAFIRRLSEKVADNYTLIHVVVADVLNKDTAMDYCNIRDKASRNSGLVARAVQFARGRPVDSRSARALERVWRHAGLLEEFAEQVSLSATDASAVIRRGLRSTESLHDFMRLAHVVQNCVVCNPCQDGRPQLDTISEDCWRLICSYLLLDDVRESGSFFQG
ncbi:uncharacterized protein LOC142767609 [Rhipicephalus microplus]|uniref:uncharacterized protein LOC142767609 n=1 Tax=Rhipicephalus microplus TaxID=6941 RepID=UPI003F6A5847